MKDFVGTVVSGAIGVLALYVVGKIAFQAGYDIAEAECRYEQLQHGINAKENEKDAIAEDGQKETEEEPMEDIVPEKKPNKLGMLFGIRRMLSKKSNGVVAELIQNPENHVIEASVKGREIHVNVKPKTT